MCWCPNSLKIKPCQRQWNCSIGERSDFVCLQLAKFSSQHSQRPRSQGYSGSCNLNSRAHLLHFHKQPLTLLTGCLFLVGLLVGLHSLTKVWCSHMSWLMHVECEWLLRGLACFGRSPDCPSLHVTYSTCADIRNTTPSVSRTVSLAVIRTGLMIF